MKDVDADAQTDVVDAKEDLVDLAVEIAAAYGSYL